MLNNTTTGPIFPLVPWKGLARCEIPPGLAPPAPNIGAKPRPGCHARLVSQLRHLIDCFAKMEIKAFSFKQSPKSRVSVQSMQLTFCQSLRRRVAPTRD